MAAWPPRYWPTAPSLRSTRWHGTRIGSGFLASAEPAGRVTNLDTLQPGGMTFLVKALVFVVVVMGVYIIGKTFLFQS